MAKSDSEKVLDMYYTGRAKHFLDQFLVPLIRHEARKPPTTDVASPALAFIVTSLTGGEAAIKSNVNVNNNLN